ncbi:MAG: hypothetical protein WBP81_27550, partial [Solirubrobacteraceae bacterium]
MPNQHGLAGQQVARQLKAEAPAEPEQSPAWDGSALFGPCPTVDAGEGIPGGWLAPGLELDPQLVARASRLTAVSMDMTGGYAASVRE